MVHFENAGEFFILILLFLTGSHNQVLLTILVWLWKEATFEWDPSAFLRSCRIIGYHMMSQQRMAQTVS